MGVRERKLTITLFIITLSSLINWFPSLIHMSISIFNPHVSKILFQENISKRNDDIFIRKLVDKFYNLRWLKCSGFTTAQSLIHWSFVYQYVTSPYNIKPVCKNSRHTYQLEIVILMWNRILITIYKYNLAARKSRITKYNPKVKGLTMEAGREGVVYLFSKLVLTQCKVNSN